MARRISILDDLHDLFVQTPAWLAPSLALLAFLILRFLIPALLPAPTPGIDNYILIRAALPITSIFIPFCIISAWVVAELTKFLNRRRFEKNTSLEQIRKLSWQDFEQLIAEAYRRQGYTAQVVGSSSGDGGVDIRLDKSGQVTLVQCKHWKAFSVGVQPARELLGVLTAEKAAHAILVTSGRFTAAAAAFAHNNPLTLVDGHELAQLLPTLTMASNCTPIAPAASAPSAPVPTAPHCPKCNTPMHLKTARRGPNPGSQFWACPRFPNCRGTRPLIS